MTHTENLPNRPAAERIALKTVRRLTRERLAQGRIDRVTRLPRFPEWHTEVGVYNVTSPTGQNLGGKMTFAEALAVETILGPDGWVCVTRPTAAQKRTAKRWAAAGIGAD